MRRLLAVSLAVVVAALATGWLLGRADGAADAARCAEVEALLRQGELAAARTAADRARPELPDHLAHYLDAVLLLSEGGGRDAEATEAAERAWAAGPAAHDDWRVVSLVYALRANARSLDRAWEALAGYVERHPEDERGLAEAARHWLELRDPPDAARGGEYLDRIDRLPGPTVAPSDATAVAPDFLSRLRSRRAALRGQLGSAREAAEARVREAPGDADAWTALGEACRKSGDVPGARKAYREAVRLAPTQVVLRKQLAMLLLLDDWGNEDVGEVTAALLALAPDDPEAHLLRARGLVREERIDDAIDVYRRLLDRPDLTPRLRLDSLRNLSMALYDWKQGGKEGLYLDDARKYLAEYRRLGGEFDLRLRDIWAKLGLGPLPEDGERR